MGFSMIKILAKSIREYKKPAILTPILVTGEVVFECIIPYLIAQLVNQIQAGCEMIVIVKYGAVLVVLALLSLLLGAMAGSYCATASCAWPGTCARTCSTRSRAIPLKTSTSSPFPVW